MKFRGGVRFVGGNRRNYWQQEVFKRDGFKCKYPDCYQAENLEAHHIKTSSKNPLLKFNIQNGITLCKEHHNLTKMREGEYESLFLSILESKTEVPPIEVKEEENGLHCDSIS